MTYLLRLSLASRLILGERLALGESSRARYSSSLRSISCHNFAARVHQWTIAASDGQFKFSAENRSMCFTLQVGTAR